MRRVGVNVENQRGIWLGSYFEFGITCRCIDVFGLPMLIRDSD